MTNILLQRYARLGETFNPEEVVLKKALRVNTLKIAPKELQTRLEKRGVTLEEIPFISGSFWYEAAFSLSSTAEYLAGYFYLQETASQLPAKILLEGISDFSNSKVLDMCAAPGSKTTQLAAIMKNKGTIVALDSHDARLDIVRSNCERQGIQNVVCIRKEAEYVKDTKLTFSHILLDAPCSGNFCVEPGFFEGRTIYDINSRVSIQQKLFKAAYGVLEKSGTLVYSTCSLEPEENELLINWALQKFPDLIIQEISLDIGDAGVTDVFDKQTSPLISKTKRFWPHKTNTEGFFIAKLVKV